VKIEASAVDLAGRSALVTGGGRGIGRAIALALARAGARLVLAGRNESRLEETAAEIRAPGGSALVVQMDVADPESIARGAARIQDEMSAVDGQAGVPRLDRRAGAAAVDILINNAGVAESAPLARTDLALWARHLAVNATGPFLLTRAFLPRMLERRWGRVINIASTAALDGAPYIAAYAASKHALLGLTRAVAAETAGTGVTVNAICPGYAATDLVWSGARRISERTGRPFDEAVQAMAKLNASGQLIEPEAVAAAVLELALDAAADRTGEAVVLS
jgi:NAD(P)-dependent dehydrogenase (short-subunit alcohol dehydrogenase family)